MKKRSNRVLRLRNLWVSGIYLLNPCFGQTVDDSLVIRCATDQVEEYRNRVDPSYQLDRLKTEQLIQEHVGLNRSGFRVSADVIRIPVVVHVVHNQLDGKIGGAGNSNISEEQIRSQLMVLNEDYRKKAGTRGFNSNPVGVDTQIEFELAQYDPNGHKVDGITRTYSKTASFSPYTDDALLANIIYWPSDRYLNIWVCTLNSGFLGAAQLPSTLGLEGLNNIDIARAQTDGIMIDYKAFGSTDYMASKGPITSTTYNLGRTTTHEIGHWLGLLHTWGKVDNVCGSDYCEDTPPAKMGNSTLECDARYVVCSGVTSQVMIENYMDYSPDRCMNIFTKNQLERMNAVLAISPRRIALVKAAIEGRLDEGSNLTVEIFPNPSQGEIYANVRFSSFQNFSASVYDQRGILMSTTSFKDVWSRKMPITTDGLIPGLYILRVSTGTETIAKRFVIN